MAIWTDDEVASLNAFQAAGVMHPFTCGTPTCYADLLAIPDGWVCPGCKVYTQDWCHGFMKDWSWGMVPLDKRLKAKGIMASNIPEDDVLRIHPRHVPTYKASTELLCFVHDLEEKYELTTAEVLAILADVIHVRVSSCVKAERA